MTDAAAAYRDDLLAAGVLFSTGIDGIYGRSGDYQRVADALCAMVTRLGGGRFESVYFPPILSRAVFNKTDYLQSFPDLMGSVHIFRGDDRRHAALVRAVEEDGDWQSLLEPADVVLASAACHPLYPMCTGALPPGGRRFEIHGSCFRHEPSTDPARMQAFHMHELVYVGEPDEAEAHRDEGLERGLQALRDLGLEMEAVAANDPFFGRLGTMLAHNQLDEALKIEGVTPITSTERPTAIMSGNCHRDHFGLPFSITTADGGVAHSACVAFGVDRITLALLRRHGLRPADWPAAVRSTLWP
ncbi:MAG: amino acid--[acyl-carrier-protein] ligase [Acidimicrobiales bacterium]